MKGVRCQSTTFKTQTIIQNTSDKQSINLKITHIDFIITFPSAPISYNFLWWEWNFSHNILATSY